MTHNEQALLRLVRLSLAADAVREDALLPTGIDWPALLAMAWRQGVSALVLDGLERLPESQRPPKPLLLQWIGRAAMMEQLYAKHEQCIASLADFYACHGIRMLLLKGVGCSWCWPRPQHRPVGDVDVYLFGQKEEADQLVEQELGMAVHREYHKHSTFSYHGVEVENHAKFIDDVSHKSNISFEKTLMDVLAQETCMASPIHHVCLPPPTFGALFLLRHTGEHFASNEILLRHVLDVGTYFQQHHAAMDWSYIYKVYKEQRMTRFFNAIATICVEYFGMDAACFSSEDSRFAFERDLPLANRILADIFAEKEKLPMSTVGIDTLGKKLKYAIGKSRRWWHNRWKYRLVYNENIFESFVWLAKNRLNCASFF